MRVLHLGKYHPPVAGGMETYLGDLLPALREQGIDARALVHDSSARGYRRDGVWAVPSLGRWLFTPLSPAYPLWLRRLLTEFRPQLLHVHMPNPSAFWLLASGPARRVPWIVHWHADVDPSQSRALTLAYRGYAPLERCLLRRSTAIIATSHAYLAASQPLRAWQGKTRVIPLGRTPDLPPVDGADLGFARSSWGASGTRLLAVGRQSFYKGFDDLLRAAASVPGLHLVLAGPGTRAAWQPLVRTLGLTERVQLADYQPANRLHALLRTCDGLCLPSNSRAEAFGLVLLEAMLHGKPVIAADVAGSGISEVVAPGRTGQLFPPGDVAALAAALTDLARDPARWKAMGEQGRQRFTRHYRIDAGAAALDALYRELPVGCRLEERLRDEPGL